MCKHAYFASGFGTGSQLCPKGTVYNHVNANATQATDDNCCESPPVSCVNHYFYEGGNLEVNGEGESWMYYETFGIGAEDADACQMLCNVTAACKHWLFLVNGSDPGCHLKDDTAHITDCNAGHTDATSCVSGPKDCTGAQFQSHHTHVELPNCADLPNRTNETNGTNGRNGTNRTERTDCVTTTTTTTTMTTTTAGNSSSDGNSTSFLETTASEVSPRDTMRSLREDEYRYGPLRGGT
jgi:hypothetical protein